MDARVGGVGRFELFDVTAAEAHHITAGDSVKLALLRGPSEELSSSVFLEIWDPGGAQPDNSHPDSTETFFFLAGKGVAHCDGDSSPVHAGQLLVLHATSLHRIENTGSGRLYAITTMTPDHGFADLVARGPIAEMSDTDRAVLASLARHEIAEVASIELARHRAPQLDSHDPFVLGPTVLDAGTPDGPLAGLTLAVKDLYDVAGTRTGAGNPVRLASAPVATASARAVDALCRAGARLVGKTVTDELAFSLSGTNVHYGTPLNPRAPDRVPGGSSSGSVSAVASGLVDIALGTDTGGSVRVPASYCGVYGLRTTHGRISRDGCLLLAPSFCTVGLFARTTAVLERARAALRDGASSEPVPPRTPSSLIVVPALIGLADEEARAPLTRAIERLSASCGLSLEIVEAFSADEVLELRNAFRTIQMFEAFELHGGWTREHAAEMGPGIAARFAAAGAVNEEENARARERRAEFRQAFADLLGDGAYLVQPAASGPAPSLRLEGEVKDDLRARTLALTALGGLAGAPVVALPLVHVDKLPLGLAVVGRPGDDDALVGLARAVEEDGDPH